MRTRIVRRALSAPRTATLKRKAFFVDEAAIRRLRRLLGVKTDAEAVRAAIDELARMEQFRRFMDRTANTVSPGTFRI